MHYEEARQQFVIRYYQWALQDCRREVEHGFTLLRTIQGRAASRYLAFISTFQKEEQVRVAEILVRRFHQQALELLGDIRNQDEEGLCQAYMATVLERSPKEQEILKQGLAGKSQRGVSRKRLASAIRTQLDSILGDTPQQLGPNVWWYKAWLRGWAVQTYVDVGGTYHQLSYMHRIGVPGFPYLHEGISILAWLGIAGQTSWDLLADVDVSIAADSLTAVCSHFMRAVPSLLADLSTDQV